MKLALDTQPGLTQNWRAMAHTIQSLSHDRVKLNFDPGNLVFLNEQVQVDTSLARVCQHVAHVYLRDCCSFGTRCYGALGTGGAVDFSCVREILLMSDQYHHSFVQLLMLIFLLMVLVKNIIK